MPADLDCQLSEGCKDAVEIVRRGDQISSLWIRCCWTAKTNGPGNWQVVTMESRLVTNRCAISAPVRSWRERQMHRTAWRRMASFSAGLYRTRTSLRKTTLLVDQHQRATSHRAIPSSSGMPYRSASVTRRRPASRRRAGTWIRPRLRSRDQAARRDVARRTSSISGIGTPNSAERVSMSSPAQNR
jgi:hypothetical protein